VSIASRSARSPLQRLESPPLRAPAVARKVLHSLEVSVPFRVLIVSVE
jgi:hypothetical protein